MKRRNILGAMMLTVVPSLARAQFRPQLAALDILKSGTPTHAFEVRDVETYRLFIARPNMPTGGILYMLDGNGAFDQLMADHLALAPGLTVVGLGYPTEFRFDPERRSLDYTPPLAAFPVPDPDRPDRLAGGANLFLPRVTGDLRRVAEEGMDITHRTLWGHSFGGLFTLYTLRTAPDAFNRYAPISPSIWWGGRALEKLPIHPPSRETSVLIAYGDAEARRGDMEEAEFRQKQVEAQTQRETFVKTLRETTHLTVRQEVFAGLQHGQTLAASLPLVLPFAE